MPYTGPIVTRTIGPNAKGSQLAWGELDNNFLYLEQISLGASQLQFYDNLDISEDNYTISAPGYYRFTVGTATEGPLLYLPGPTGLTGRTITLLNQTSETISFDSGVQPKAPDDSQLGSLSANTNLTMVSSGTSWWLISSFFI